VPSWLAVGSSEAPEADAAYLVTVGGEVEANTGDLGISGVGDVTVRLGTTGIARFIWLTPSVSFIKRKERKKGSARHMVA